MITLSVYCAIDKVDSVNIRDLEAVDRVGFR